MQVSGCMTASVVLVTQGLLNVKAERTGKGLLSATASIVCDIKVYDKPQLLTSEGLPIVVENKFLNIEKI